MLYNSNFDDSSFTNKNYREFNKTIDDPCAVQQRTEDNSKKLKFLTTNNIDLIDGRANMNFFGMTIRDQLFVPADSIDSFSKLRHGQTGNIITNCNITNEFGQLPVPTMPSRYQLYHGDIITEDKMRNKLETNRNSCNPRESELYKRHFYLFGKEFGVEIPDASLSVETNDNLGFRGGSSTRFARVDLENISMI